MRKIDSVPTSVRETMKLPLRNVPECVIYFPFDICIARAVEMKNIRRDIKNYGSDIKTIYLGPVSVGRAG